MVFGTQLYNGRGSYASICANTFFANEWRHGAIDIAHTELERLNRRNILSLPGFDLVDFRHDDR